MQLFARFSACGVSNARSSCHLHVQIAVTAPLKIFFIYETPEITASILFVSQSKHTGNGSRNQKSVKTPVSTAWGKIMKKLLLAGVSLVAIGSIDGAIAADAALSTKAPASCTGGVIDPYKNYACLDTYLGSDFFSRFINYYKLEWGHEAAPSDPKAPPGRRDYWPATPQSIPPSADGRARQYARR
jgi:hypothetical protein